MKVISLLQPWATLVVIGAKTFETRSWDTKHRGPLLIHASKRKDAVGMQMCCNEPFYHFIKGIQGFYALPFGAIIGMVTLDFTQSSSSIEKDIVNTNEWHFGDYTAGRFAWKLKNPRKFDVPVPAGGSLGLWDFPENELLHLKQ